LSLAGHSPSDQIRIAKEMNRILQLSPETQQFLRTPSQRNCVICHKPYTPSGNRQKYCPQCKIDGEKETFRRYKATKGKYYAAVKRLRKRRGEVAVELAAIDKKIRTLGRLRDMTHLWQFREIRAEGRIYRFGAKEALQLVELKKQARRLARKFAAIQHSYIREKRRNR